MDINKVIAEIWRPHWRKELETTTGLDLSDVPDVAIDEWVKNIGESDE